MPPKKVESIVKEDTGCWGVFVNIAIPSGSVSLESGAAGSKLHLAVSYPGPYPPLASEPAESQDGVTYQFGYAKKFRRDEGLDALHSLLNGPVSVALVDSATGTPLASTALDMLPFALGQQAFELTNLQLQPAAAAAPGAPQVRGCVLPSVQVSLTQRVKPEGALFDAAAAAPAAGVPPGTPPAAAAGGSKPMTPVSQSGTGSRPGTTGTVPLDPVIPEDQLPEPQPYRFVSEEEAAAGANVLTVAVGLDAGSTLPPGLQAAMDAAAGRLTLQLALALPAPGAPLLLGPGTVSGGALVLPGGGTVRRCISGEAAEALRSVLEDGESPLCLEVARYLGADDSGKAAAGGLGDGAWEAYRALGALEGAEALVDAGAATYSGRVPLVAFPADGSATSVLPPYAPPAGRYKSIEEAPAPPGTNAWVAAGTTLAVSLEFAKPLVPAWAPPPPPAVVMTSLVPPRDLHPPPPPQTPEEAVQAQAALVIRALAEAYSQHKQQQEPQGAVVDAPPAQKHKKLIWELNRSGAYVQLRDSLKGPLMRVVKERLGRTGSMSPNDMEPHYNALYTRLMDACHGALNGLGSTAPRPPKAQPPSPAALSRLAQLAEEAEACGDVGRARVLWRQRLADGDNPEVHFDYARFCARTGAPAAAAAALRDVLAIEPRHEGALAGTALLALHAHTTAGVEGGGDAWTTAAAAAHALLELQPGSSASSASSLLAWGLMHAVYEAGGASTSSQLASCTYEVRRRERAALKEGAAPEDANAHWRVWCACVDWGLRSLALAAERRTLGLKKSAARLGYELLLVRARMLLLPQDAPAPQPLQPQASEAGADTAAEPAEPSAADADAAAALAAVKAARRAAPSGDVRALVLAGDAEWESRDNARRTGPARAAYQAAVEAAAAAAAAAAPAPAPAPTAAPAEGAAEGADAQQQQAAPLPAAAAAAVPLRAHVRLGEAYLLSGQPQCALDVFTAALAAAAAAPAAVEPGQEQQQQQPAAERGNAISAGGAACLWLGAARAALALGDADGAEGALRRANAADVDCAPVWGLLAQVSMSAGRVEEGAAALRYALRLSAVNAAAAAEAAAAEAAAAAAGGAADPPPESSTLSAMLQLDLSALLQEAAHVYSGRGEWRCAAGVLEQALEPGEDSFQVRYALAHVLQRQQDLPGARMHAAAAARSASSDTERGLLAELTKQLAP